jgi:predicted O-methyltransferase YrrM
MLTSKELEHNLTIPGWFGEGDIHGLSTLASQVNNGTIIELGSMHGRSAYCLSKSSPTSNIFCLDFWSGWVCKTQDGIRRSNSIDTFKSYTAECTNVTPIRVFRGIEVTPQWEDPIDMVFIDTSHENPDDWNLIEYWLPKIKKGGIICGHDYYYPANSEICHYPDVVANCDRLESMLGKKVTIHPHSVLWSFII